MIRASQTCFAESDCSYPYNSTDPTEVSLTIITDSITFAQLEEMAAKLFGDMVKGVVDVNLGLLALDAELHSDLEALLIQKGSNQKNLWGINLYPALTGSDYLEFDSLINIRPAEGNRSRGVDDPAIRSQISDIVNKRISR